jgi:hypothetical protein
VNSFLELLSRKKNSSGKSGEKIPSGNSGRKFQRRCSVQKVWKIFEWEKNSIQKFWKKIPEDVVRSLTGRKMGCLDFVLVEWACWME